MRTAIGTLLCAAFLAGCASATGMMLSEDTALISAEGKGPNDHDKVIRDALVQAARLTNEHGYRYFVVLTADDATHTVTIQIPGRLLYNQPPRPNGQFGVFNGPYAAGSNYMAPDRKLERVRPAMDIIIRMYRPGEISLEMDGVWDADMILDPKAPQLVSR